MDSRPYAVDGDRVRDDEEHGFMPQAQSRNVGGQAVLEGVMMRGATTWAVSVRTPEGAIVTEVHDAPTWSRGWTKVPLVRGVVALVESMALGVRALAWSANRSLPQEEQLSRGAMGGTVAASLVLFVALFVVAPAVGMKALEGWAGASRLFDLGEGVVRLAFFLGYVVAIGRVAEIRRVFEYHGAEHKAIAAYESTVPLTPESAQTFGTQHVRCGTNFLLLVMLLTSLAFSVIGRPGWLALVLSRLVLLPVVAAVAYEAIRFASRNMERRWVALLMRPGLGLQRLTTREPDLEQLEVAIAALWATLSPEERDEVDARALPTALAARAAGERVA